MAAPYVKTVFTTGDVITQTKARNWEDGIEILSGGGIAIASQAALDFLYASSSTQLARLAKGTAYQVPQMNASATGYQFGYTNKPTSDDGMALGDATTLRWSDLFLASGGVINWANGNATITHSTGALAINVPTSFSSTTPIVLTNGTSNWVQFNASGVAAPSFTTSSVGTKLLLYPSIGAATADYAIGVESTAVWFSLPSTASTGWKFYGGTTVVGQISAAGILTMSGFGTHSLSGGGTGGNALSVANTTDGTANYARISITAGTATTYLEEYSQSFTPAGTALASGFNIYAAGAGGISITAGAGEVRIYSGATQQFNVGATYIKSQAIRLNTTGSAANVYVSDDSNGYLLRSTSSARYKKDIDAISVEDAYAVVAGLRGVTWEGTSAPDQGRRFAGFVAEEVHRVAPILTTLNPAGLPEWVMADRVPAYMLPVLQDLVQRMAAVEQRVH